MNAEIITIGDELLVGKTLDTNSSFIARELQKIGVSVKWMVTCEDKHDVIVDTLKTASDRSDIIMVTGGLGPTYDDVTKKAACSFFDTSLKRSDEAFAHLTVFFEKRQRPFEGVNLTQADLPAKCQYIKNGAGTAPGMYFNENDTHYLFMPGVPVEMRYILTKSFLPMFTSKISLAAWSTLDIQTVGVAEAKLSELIDEKEVRVEVPLKMAYLPRLGCVTLRIYFKEEDRELAERKSNELEAIVGEYVYAIGDKNLQEAMVELLNERGETLATAESCTGGTIAKKITSVSGSSNVFPGTIVSYSNQIKNKLLGVKEQTLEEHGAVSEPVVIEMVKGVVDQMESNYGIAVSGIAGPTGGTPTKPVGTVWVAVGDKNDIETKCLHLGGTREQNIEFSSIAALNLLRKFIFKSA